MHPFLKQWHMYNASPIGERGQGGGKKGECGVTCVVEGRANGESEGERERERASWVGNE